MQLKFLSILLKTCLFTLQLKLIAPKFITSGWRTSTFEQFISDYFAFTLNPNKPSSNLGTSTSIPASRTDVGTDPSAGLLGHNSLQWTGTGITVTLQGNANSKRNPTVSSTGIFHSAASSSKVLWKPGGNKQLRAPCMAALYWWEGNHSRGFISLCFSAGSFDVMIRHSHSSFLLPA